ncbi:hypothetical protein GOODEAATRI_018342 [Goodea atripinnis]|uniref:Uncharacterized protein n=1 Tax=Goodea atripinnis TaxID=208336 RepID=A0ABV0NL89_9TELE
MLCVRGLQRLKAALYLHRNAAYRSLTSAEVLQKEDPILNAVRPTKESQKGCVLCSITVDFKNIQVSQSTDASGFTAGKFSFRLDIGDSRSEHSAASPSYLNRLRAAGLCLLL